MLIKFKLLINKIITFALIIIIVQSCSNVPLTERKQLIILGDDVLYPKAFDAFKKFKSDSKLIKEGEQFDEIQEISKKIIQAINSYYSSLNIKDPSQNFEWEVILIDNKEIKNAWCMPGGKIAFYTGILPIASNKDGIAAIMGHEIAHAVARHSSERASQSLLIDLGTLALEKLLLGGNMTKSTKNVYGYVRQLGVELPFSRNHETEADYLGLIFMRLGGYNVNESYKVWERMINNNEGKRSPEFMSTHPSSKNRVSNLKKWIPEVLSSFQPI